MDRRIDRRLMTTTHPTLIDLSAEIRKTIILLLNDRLADAVDLYVQAKSSHWNVRGPGFIGLHKLFDEVVAVAEDNADTIAERIGQLGGAAESSVQKVAKKTALPEFDLQASNSKDVVAIFAKALASFAKGTRAAIDTCDEAGDKVSADIMTSITRATDKMLWFVEAHLQ